MKLTTFEKTKELTQIFEAFKKQSPRKSMQFVIEEAVKEYAKKHLK